MIICKCDKCGVAFERAITIDCEPSLYDDLNGGRKRLFSDVPLVELHEEEGKPTVVRVVYRDICTDCIPSIANNGNLITVGGIRRIDDEEH